MLSRRLRERIHDPVEPAAAPGFFDGRLKELAGAAAFRTEAPRGAAGDPQFPHACGAKNMLAFSTLQARRDAVVMKTARGAVRHEQLLPWRRRQSNGRNGNGHGRLCHEHFHVSHPESLSGENLRFLDAVALDERAVTRTEIAHEHRVIRQPHFAVPPRNRWVRQENVVLAFAAKTVAARSEQNLRGRNIRRLYEQSCHVRKIRLVRRLRVKGPAIVNRLSDANWTQLLQKTFRVNDMVFAEGATTQYFELPHRERRAASWKPRAARCALSARASPLNGSGKSVGISPAVFGVPPRVRIAARPGR
jgi:hypothetical protein